MFDIELSNLRVERLLLRSMKDCNGKKSTIITSQVPVSKSHDLIGEDTVADATMERIIRQAHRLE